MEVVTTTAITQMEITPVPAIMDTDSTVMDILVKVNMSWGVEIYVITTVLGLAEEGGAITRASHIVNSMFLDVRSLTPDH